MMEKMIHDGNLRTIFQQEYLKYLNSVFARKFEYKSVSSKLETLKVPTGRFQDPQ